MIFTTYWFFAFALIYFTIFWAFTHPTIRLCLLIVSCLIFHGKFAGPAGVIPIFGMGVIVYFTALSKRPKLIIFTILLCVFSLLIFKYSEFFFIDLVGIFNQPYGKRLWEEFSGVLPVTPPLAISFFVFEYVHYLTDVYRGGFPIKKPTDFLLFSIFFPSLAAGPIKRYNEFIPSLHEGLNSRNFSNFTAGLVRVCVGIFKKIILADNLTALIQDMDLVEFEYHSFSMRWFIFICTALRIYFDFSGYSDMAIGFAKMMGIKIPENFNAPYLATNLQDFWLRWHISLSAWVRDYIYIPLGGNRTGIGRKVANGLLAFSIIGLWHGTSWHFVAWGLYHGFGLGFFNVFKKFSKNNATLDLIFSKYSLVGWFATQIFVFVGWLFFFYPVKEALNRLELLCGF